MYRCLSTGVVYSAVCCVLSSQDPAATIERRRRRFLKRDRRCYGEAAPAQFKMEVIF
jgi:hypothetical protein